MYSHIVITVIMQRWKSDLREANDRYTFTSGWEGTDTTLVLRNEA